MSEEQVGQTDMRQLEDKIEVLRERFVDARRTVVRDRLLVPMMLIVAGCLAPWCWHSDQDELVHDFHNAIGLFRVNVHGDHRVLLAMLPVAALAALTVVLWVRALAGDPDRERHGPLGTCALLLGVAALIAVYVLSTDKGGYYAEDVHVMWAGPGLFVAGAWLLAVQALRGTPDF